MAQVISETALEDASKRDGKRNGRRRSSQGVPFDALDIEFDNR